MNPPRLGLWGILIVWVLSPSLVNASDLVYTKSGSFRIPYRVDPVELQRVGTVKIRLYQSTDRGKTWEHVQSVNPAQGYFDHQARSQGEFWFAVRSLDSQGQLHPPENEIEIGLKVVIDQKPPILSLKLTESAPGEVTLSYRAADLALNPQKFQVQQFHADSQNWQTITLPREALGTVSWKVPQGGMVAVRGAIADQAGNVGYGQVQTQIRPANQQRPTRQPPIASGDGNQISQKQPEINFPREGTNLTSAEGGSNPPIREQTLTTQTFPRNYRFVNDTQFKIDYQVDDVGPSGVGQVELFITEDQGKKWWRYGVDEDRQSPFHVKVPNEGLYGFAIRVRSGAGLVTPAPKAGDAPDILIAVDQKGPEAKLVSIHQGRGAERDKLIVKWSVSDPHLETNPVQLSFAHTPEGPWFPLSQWVPNTGSHVIAMTYRTPPQFFLKLTARDRIGNITEVRTPRPILVDHAKPKARIVGVEPTDGSRQE